MGGTNTKTKANGGSKHQGGFSCYVSPVIDEEVYEEAHLDALRDTTSFLCGAVLTTAGVIAVSDAFTSGLPIIS